MRPNSIRKRKLFHFGPTVVLNRLAIFCFVGISPQEIENATPQFSRVFLQIVKEIDAEPVWMNMAFTSRDDRAGVRTQEQTSPQQIPIDFVDICYVECLDLMVMHLHGQM